MLLCDWCHETIHDEDPAKLMLSRDDADRYPSVILRGWPTFHRDCGILALYAAQEAIEDGAPGSRPDPAAEELLNHIPTMNTPSPDGDLGDQRMRHCLGETKAVYTLRDAGIRTLVDLSFRTRAEVAGLPRIGAKTLETLEAAMAARGLKFREQGVREAVA